MMLSAFDSKGEAGAVFAVLGLLLLLAGIIGYTFTGEIEDVPLSLIHISEPTRP